VAWLLAAIGCGGEPSSPAPSEDAPPKVEPAEPEPPREPDSEPESETDPPEAEPKAEQARVPWPPTSLPLTLLATLDDPAGESDRATIRDADSGVIMGYRAGDEIREGVKVLAVESGVVELRRDGEIEYLSISPIPFEVDPSDVFYPDLVADLGTAMSDGVQMPPGPGYVLKTPGHAWGTQRTVALLRDAVRAYARDNDGPKVRIGDLSLPGGGPFPPHLSHREGRDVDIGYILQGPNKDARYFHNVSETNFDEPRTWALIEALLATGEVAYIFMDYEIQKRLYAHAETNGVGSDRLGALFQYPNGRRASRGIIRHWRSHRGHFHVRFRR